MAKQNARKKARQLGPGKGGANDLIAARFNSLTQISVHSPHHLNGI